MASEKYSTILVLPVMRAKIFPRKFYFYWVSSIHVSLVQTKCHLYQSYLKLCYVCRRSASSPPSPVWMKSQNKYELVKNLEGTNGVITKDFIWRESLVAVRVRPVIKFLVTVIGRDWTWKQW